MEVDWTLTLSDIVVSVVTLAAAFFAAWLGGKMASSAAIDAVHEEARIAEEQRAEDRQQRQRERDEDQRRLQEAEKDRQRIAFTNLYHELLLNAGLLHESAVESTVDSDQPYYQPNYINAGVWIHLDLNAYDAAVPYFIYLGEPLNRLLRLTRRSIKAFNAVASYNNNPETRTDRTGSDYVNLREMSTGVLKQSQVDMTLELIIGTAEGIRDYMRIELGMDTTSDSAAD